MITDIERDEDKYAEYDEDDAIPGVRPTGKEGRRLGSYTGLMMSRQFAGNGARKRLRGA